jgi:hypothetical protein
VTARPLPATAKPLPATHEAIEWTGWAAAGIEKVAAGTPKVSMRTGDPAPAPAHLPGRLASLSNWAVKLIGVRRRLSRIPAAVAA